MGEYKLTPRGERVINNYLMELKARRKEILDAGLDTVDITPDLPTAEDIFDDLIDSGFDDEGEAYNRWYVTDNYDADYPVFIKLGIDVIEI